METLLNVRQYAIFIVDQTRGSENKSMSISTRKKSIICLVAVIILSTLLAAYHGYYKLYFYEDEVLSYTYANSKKGGFIEADAGKWYSGSDFYTYTYVSNGQGFDYPTVFLNQQSDAHPPVYAFLLHTICSFFPDHFSKWTGLGLNFVAFGAIMILLYLIFMELFPNRPYFCVFLCLIFGITAGVIDLIVFIRMYVVLMVFTSLCLLWHIRNLNRQVSLLSFLLLSLLTFIGTMTHYFYLIFAFFAAAFFCIHKLLQKEIRSVISYIVSMAVAATLVLLTWRKVIIKLFTLDAASDTVSQELTPGFIIAKILQMIRNTNEELFGNRLKYLVIIIGIYAIYLLIRNREKLKRAFKVSAGMAMTILVTVLFFLTVSAITPYLSTRYFSAVFPFILAFTVITMEQVAKDALRSPVLGLVIIALFFLWPELQLLRNGLVDENRRIIAEVSTKYSEELCLLGAGIQPEENVFELRKFDKIYVYSGDNANDAASEIAAANQLVVYVPGDMDPDAYVANIRSVNPKLTNLERLYVAYYSTCYLMSE